MQPTSRGWNVSSTAPVATAPAGATASADWPTLGEVPAAAATTHNVNHHNHSTAPPTAQFNSLSLNNAKHQAPQATAINDAPATAEQHTNHNNVANDVNNSSSRGSHSEEDSVAGDASKAANNVGGVSGKRKVNRKNWRPLEIPQPPKPERHERSHGRDRERGDRERGDRERDRERDRGGKAPRGHPPRELDHQNDAHPPRSGRGGGGGGGHRSGSTSAPPPRENGDHHHHHYAHDEQRVPRGVGRGGGSRGAPRGRGAGGPPPRGARGGAMNGPSSYYTKSGPPPPHVPRTALLNIVGGGGGKPEGAGPIDGIVIVGGGSGRATPCFVPDDMPSGILYYEDPHPISDPSITTPGPVVLGTFSPTASIASVPSPSTAMVMSPVPVPVDSLHTPDTPQIPVYITPFYPPASAFTPVTTTVPISPQPVDVQDAIRNQIEYYLSEQNLERDMFMRRKMDAEGYMPITLIASFHRLQSITQDVQLIIEALQSSQLVELSPDKLKARTKLNPTKWPVLESNSPGVPADAASNLVGNNNIDAPASHN